MAIPCAARYLFALLRLPLALTPPLDRASSGSLIPPVISAIVRLAEVSTGTGLRPMSFWLLSVIIFIAVLAAVTAWLVGLERVWRLFGPADLGSVEFETLQRRKTPNDALACLTGFCSADSDLLPPIYPVEAAALRKLMRQALMGERRLTLVAVEDEPPADRYVQRSEMLRFPDTVVVRYMDLKNGSSTVAIYSRSKLGRKDFGVNIQRIERWLKKLTLEVRRMREEV